jgi:hypothetical protein
VPELDLYLIGGVFTTNGTDPMQRIGYTDGVAASWLEFGDGIDNGTVWAIAYDHYSGDVFIGGDFTPTGVTTTENCQRGTYGVTGWLELPNGGLDDTVIDVMSTHDGYIYFGGAFEQTMDTTIELNHVARYNIETNEWEPMANGLNGDVQRLIVGDDGLIYAFGSFTEDGDSAYNLRGIAVWNGYSWEEVTVSYQPVIADAAQDANGIWWYGSFEVGTVIHPLFGVQSIYGFRNQVEYPQPFLLPHDTITGFEGINALSFGENNEMLVAFQGFDLTEPTLAPRQFEITYEGEVPVAPTFVLRGRQRIRILENLTAEAGLYFKNSTVLSEGDRMFVRLGGFKHRIYSDRRASLMRFVATGASDFGNFKLRQGLNRINIFCLEAGTDVSNHILWRNTYQSIHAVEAL